MEAVVIPTRCVGFTGPIRFALAPLIMVHLRPRIIYSEQLSTIYRSPCVSSPRMTFPFVSPLFFQSSCLFNNTKHVLYLLWISEQNSYFHLSCPFSSAGCCLRETRFCAITSPSNTAPPTRIRTWFQAVVISSRRGDSASTIRFAVSALGASLKKPFFNP